MPMSADRHTSPRALRGVHLVGLLLIVVLGAYLRLANQPDNPGWFTDEGTHLDIAKNLSHGRVQYFAIEQSTLLFGRMPVFDTLLAALLRAGIGGIQTLRALTGVLGVLSVIVLCIVVHRASRDPALALLAALMLAVYPQAVLYSRFGFSYNLLTPLALIAILGLHEYLAASRLRWLVVSAAAIGLGAVADLLMLVLIPGIVLIALARRRRHALWAGAIVTAPLLVYGLAMLATSPQALLFDTRFTVSRVGSLPIVDQLVSVATNYTTLVSQDSWIALGLTGLFMLPSPRLRGLSLLSLLMPIALVGRTVALHSLSFYYMIPWLPLVALGVASLMRYGLPRIRQIVFEGLSTLCGWTRWSRILSATSVLTLAMIAAAPVAVSIVLTLDRVSGRFGTVIDPFLIEPDDARRVADYVNSTANAEDLIIASPGVGWQLRASVADFQMAVAASGQATVHLPAGIPPDRFAFDARLSNARLVIVDNLWRNWGAVHMPQVAAMIREVESWPLALRSGEIAVYRNPSWTLPDKIRLQSTFKER